MEIAFFISEFMLPVQGKIQHIMTDVNHSVRGMIPHNMTDTHNLFGGAAYVGEAKNGKITIIIHPNIEIK